MTEKLVHKIWGFEIWLHNEADYCVKELHVEAGAQSSLHFHKVKTETFYVAKGSIELFHGGLIEELFPGDFKSIDLEEPHRFRATSSRALIIEASSHHDDSDVYRLEESSRWIAPIYIERFLQKVGQHGVNDCWPWIGASAIYGHFDIKGKMVRAHRVSFLIFNGPIPPNKIVRHSCDNHLCVNPKHLMLGSHQENSTDMVNRGRSTRGERSSSLLTEEKVKQIRESKLSTAELARTMGVSFQVVRNARFGLTWRHVHG